MRILITGIHGFVGSCLVASLAGSHEIFGLGTSTVPVQGVAAIYTWEDLGTLPPVDAVIHLAGVAHDVSGTKARDEYMRVNVGLTRQIYDWFLRSDATRFIFFSSVKAAADTVAGTLTEDTAPAPKGIYGESKLEAERYIHANPASEDKSVYILRPCLILGNKGNIRLLSAAVRHLRLWPLGAFDNSRSYLSVPNMQEIIARLLQSNAPTGIYNVADDTPMSTNELVGLIGENLGKSARIVNVSPRLIRLACRAGDVLRLPLNSPRLKKMTENYVVSNAKIKHALGISELPTCRRITPEMLKLLK